MNKREIRSDFIERIRVAIDNAKIGEAVTIRIDNQYRKNFTYSWFNKIAKKYNVDLLYFGVTTDDSQNWIVGFHRTCK